MQKHFSVLSRNAYNCPPRIALLISAREFQFHNFLAYFNLTSYESGITTDMKWLVCERVKHLQSGAVHALIQMKHLAQILPCNLGSEMIHVICI